jgi:hypothetical protein
MNTTKTTRINISVEDNFTKAESTASTATEDEDDFFNDL